MTAYRLVHRHHADLSGDGGKRYGGRCNPRGVAAVYCSEHISLCALEILVHLHERMLPDDYVVMTIEVPGTVPTVGGSALDALDSDGLHPVWIVPSVIIQQEHNIILYPEAAGFAASIVRIEPFTFDPRLIAGPRTPRSRSSEL